MTDLIMSELHLNDMRILMALGTAFFAVLAWIGAASLSQLRKINGTVHEHNADIRSLKTEVEGHGVAIRDLAKSVREVDQKVDDIQLNCVARHPDYDKRRRRI